MMDWKERLHIIGVMLMMNWIVLVSIAVVAVIHFHAE